MNYVLTDDAEADLRGIVRYTRKEWGAAQVRTYVSKLKAGIACVAAGQGIFQELDALYRRSQKALGRYTGADEDLGTKEKDFERDRKKY